MGCVACSLGSFVSVVLNALERISLCTVCALLVCCILFTILTVMLLGIGIGYHYCSVQNSVENIKKANARGAEGAVGAASEQLSRKSASVLRSVEKAVKHGFAHHMARRDVEDLVPTNNRTLNERLLTGNNLTEIYKSLNDTLLNISSNNSFVNINRIYVSNNKTS